jgi:hypothetical protein
VMALSAALSNFLFMARDCHKRAVRNKPGIYLRAKLRKKACRSGKKGSYKPEKLRGGFKK